MTTRRPAGGTLRRSLATAPCGGRASRAAPLPSGSYTTTGDTTLRETNVKDICVELAKAGVIETSWGGGARKPKDQDLIKLVGK